MSVWIFTKKKKKKGDYRRLGDLEASRKVTLAAMMRCCVGIKRIRFITSRFAVLSLHWAPSQLTACEGLLFLWLFLKLLFRVLLFATKERASSRHNSFFLIPSINEVLVSSVL